MALSEEQLQEIASKMLETEDNSGGMALLTETYPSITKEEAYKIQLAQIHKRLERGEKIIGKKIGLLGKKIQEQLGVDEPDYGIFTEQHMLNEYHDALNLSKCNQPRIEAEIAFVLKEDLKGPGVTVTDVLRATEGIAPAIEIVDTRYDSWKFKIQDTIADRGSNGMNIIGSKLTRLDDIDLRLLGMACFKNGDLMYTAAGAEVMGNPAHGVAWLANKMADFDLSLKKGEIILSGTMGPLFEVNAGDVVEAKFDKIGSVSLKISE